MARVMLISPQFRVLKAGHSAFAKNVHRRAHPLLGIGNMATVLHSYGHDVAYLDTAIEGIQETHPYDEYSDFYGIDNFEVVRRVIDFRPQVIGISCLFTGHFPLMVSMAEAIKAALPNVPVVVGGNHATLNPEEVMRHGCIDYLLRGEGDFLFGELVNCLLHGRPISEVGSVVYRDNGVPQFTDAISHVGSMDSLPFFNWDLVPLEKYWSEGLPQNPFAKSRKAILYETSRGCPERCIFCSSAQFFGKRFRPKSASRVVDEIVQAVDRYGIEEVQFSDDNIAMNLRRFKDICDGLAPLGIHLCVPNGIRLDHHYRSDDIIRDLYGRMKRAGFYQLTFCPESGNERVLNSVIKKHLDLGKMKRLVAMARDEFGFKTHSFFIIGFPYETKREIEDTIRYAEELDTDGYSFSVATPFPPTELWKWCKDDNLIIEGAGEADYLLGKSVIKRPGGFLPMEIDTLAEQTAARLNGERIARRNPLVTAK